MPNIQDKNKTKKKTSGVLKREPNGLTLKGIKDRELYIQWRSIPAMLRLLPKEELKKMGYNIDDPIFIRLLEVSTRRQFCADFKVGINQPTIWDKEAGIIEKINALSTQENVMRFRKDVDFSFTQKVMKSGDAHRVKLWKQLYEGWNERTESVNVNLNMTPADLVAEIEARNKKIRDIEDEEDRLEREQELNGLSG